VILNAERTLLVNRCFSTRMAGRGSGVIINLCSLTSFRPSGQVAYAMGKASLKMLTELMAAELGPRGIRVNAVSGGVVDTGALDHFPNREEMLEMGSSNAAGRMVTPDDVAGAVAFPSSPDAEQMRGPVLMCDGGLPLPP